LVRRLRSKGFTAIVDLIPHNIPMVNQAIVVSPEFLQKRGDVAERILMALVDSLAFTLAQQNKAIVMKTMMKRFQLSDPAVGEEGYQDLQISVERKPFPSIDALRNVRRLMVTQNPKVANVKIEELIDNRIIRKLDESGYIDRAAATYNLK
jgi:ABC-type nitrate/sulfonate/bicarbonate transport system substrate-binding protein